MNAYILFGVAILGSTFIVFVTMLVAALIATVIKHNGKFYAVNRSGLQEFDSFSELIKHEVKLILICLIFIVVVIGACFVFAKLGVDVTP